MFFFFFQAEDGIRDLVRSRGLGDVYKRQHLTAEDARPGPDGVDSGHAHPPDQHATAEVGHQLSLIHI